MRLAYYAAPANDWDPHTTVIRPKWRATTRTSTLPVGSLAVLSCGKGMQLSLGNRTQPTNTFNRTCTQLSSHVAVFIPVPPLEARPSCIKQNHSTLPTKPLGRCAFRDVMVQAALTP